MGKRDKPTSVSRTPQKQQAGELNVRSVANDGKSGTTDTPIQRTVAACYLRDDQDLLAARASLYSPSLDETYAAVAQLAEHHVANVIVVGSNPISRSFLIAHHAGCFVRKVGTRQTPRPISLFPNRSDALCLMLNLVRYRFTCLGGSKPTRCCKRISHAGTWH